MKVQNSIALVTGANRGIGRELVLALANAGAARIYAAARTVEGVADLVAIDPRRIVAVELDVTNADQVEAVARAALDVTLLINNAGVLDFGSALEAPIEVVERNLAVNLYGPLRTTRALVPAITANGGGAVVNLLSVVALASMPGLAAYNLSKAAQHSLTQSFRASLRDQGITVHGVYPGPVDTDMAAAIPLDKTAPADVARAILAGLEAGQEDIFPDVMSAQIEAVWFKDPKGLETQFAAM